MFTKIASQSTKLAIISFIALSGTACATYSDNTQRAEPTPHQVQEQCRAIDGQKSSECTGHHAPMPNS